MKKYNVLWLEDEPEKNNTFIDRAEVDGIDLIQVFTVREFKKEFTDKFKTLDAVVLDAKGREDSLQENPSLVALNKALVVLNENNHNKKMPYFILSGYLGNDENQSAREMLSDKVIYIKGEDEVKLIRDLKAAANQQEGTQIRHKYSRVFEVCNDKYLGAKSYEPLMDLFKRVETIENFETTKDNLITVRKIIEKLVEKLVEKNIIPNEIYYGNTETKVKGGFNPSVKFICNNKNGSNFTLENNFMHPTLAYIFDNLVFVIQDSQHDKRDLKLYVDEYITQTKSPYLFKSLVFQLMDVLIWFKDFIDQNPDPEENKKLWRKVVEENEENNWIEGKVIKSVSKDFAFFRPKGATKDSDNIYIHKSNVVKFNLTDGLEINATSVFFQEPNGETKTQVKNIQLIETTEESSI